MRILNWNTQADRHRADSNKLRSIKELVASYDADVICLTEAYPEAMPNGDRTIASGLSGWGWPEDRGATAIRTSRSGIVPTVRQRCPSIPGALHPPAHALHSSARRPWCEGNFCGVHRDIVNFTNGVP